MLVNKQKDLISIYKEMPQEKLEEEIDAIFDHIFAILEVCECDSMETYPNPNIVLKISCDVIRDADQKYKC